MQNLPIKTVRRARVERILTAKQLETLKSVSEGEQHLAEALGLSWRE